MPTSSFWSIPEKRKIVVGLLFVLILTFFFVLVVRSCRRPEGESPKGYLRGLVSPVPENRLDAVLGLGRINAKNTVPDLEKILTSDPDERVRRAAAYSILVLDREKFLHFLNYPDANIRIISLETISRKEKKEAYPYLEKGLYDSLPLVKHTALTLLAQISGPDVTGVILRLAEKTTEDSSLRVDALSILGRKAGPEILDRLKSLADYEAEPAVKAAAAEAAEEIKARKEADDLENKTTGSGIHPVR